MELIFISLLLLLSPFAFSQPESAPAEIIKELKFSTDSVKTDALTLLQPQQRLKDAFGNVIELSKKTMSETIAKKIMKNKQVQLRLKFAHHCRDSRVFGKRTQETKESLFWYYEMPGTGDFSYGACGSRQEPYWSQYLVIYCKKEKALYDVKYFHLLKAKEEFEFNHPLAECK